MIKMPDANQFQQIPEECTVPVIIGNFQVTLLDIEPTNGSFRWIYRIDNINTRIALSDWVLGIDGDCLDLIGQCYTSAVFPSESTELPPLTPYDDCENPGTAPDPCPIGSPCSAGVRLVGFKFDNLEGLVAGQSQLFAFDFNQPPVIETGCAALKYGQNEFCGEICVPGCVVCPNPCDCPDDENNFDCEVDFPTTCFSLASTDPEDVLYGFCIGRIGQPTSTRCQAPAEVFVCNQVLTCCVPVLRWTRQVQLQVQFNVPKEGECQPGLLYECCNDTVIATQVCFTCAGETPVFETPTCDNTSITVNSVTETDTGDAVINYTVNLPDCASSNG
jgi:hypothetical protein